MEMKQFIIESLTREQVPSYLSAADIAFSGVRQNPSKRYCSPIKHGEYWACGLPVIVPDGISDDYLLVGKHNIGWCLPVFTKDGYIETIKKILTDWCWEKQAGYRQRTREFVIRDRNVEEYKPVYAKIFSEIDLQKTCQMKMLTIFKKSLTTSNKLMMFFSFGKYFSLALLAISASVTLKSQNVTIAYEKNDTLIKPIAVELGHYLEQATKKSVNYADRSNSSPDGNISLVIKPGFQSSLKKEGFTIKGNGKGIAITANHFNGLKKWDLLLFEFIGISVLFARECLDTCP